ncbi:AAA family ATPase [Chloroflexota bacterium]
MGALRNLGTGISIQPVEDWAEDIAKKKPQAQVIQDLLPNKRGEYIAIAGRTGIGKTNLALYLAFCLSTGTPFYGLPCKRIRVAFLEFEGDERNLIARYKKIKRGFPPTNKRLHFGIIPLSNPKEMLKDIWAQTEECRILILDPIRYLVLGYYLKPKDVTSFIQSFREMLAIHRKAAIITLPIRKPNDKLLIHTGDVYSMKGATEYADSATSVLLLEKTPYSRDNDNKVTLHFAKHRIALRELKPLDLQFRINKCIFESEGELATE